MTCEKCESVVYIPLLFTLSIQTLHKEVGKDLKLAETIAWPLCTFVLDFRGVQYFQTKEENLKTYVSNAHSEIICHPSMLSEQCIDESTGRPFDLLFPVDSYVALYK